MRTIKALLYTSILVAILVEAPTQAFGQTEKVTSRKNMQGQTVQSPYLTYGEYRSAAIRHRGDGAASNPVTFKQLLAVPSLEAVERLIGEPARVNKRTFPDGKQFTATLNYDGMKLKYVRRNDGVVRLNSFEIYGPAWELTVGGKALRPGMSVNDLDPTVRKHIEKDSFLDAERLGLDPGEVDGVTVLRVAQPGTASAGGGTAGNGVELTGEGNTQISIHVNRERGAVTVVRFHRIV